MSMLKLLIIEVMMMMMAVMDVVVTMKTGEPRSRSAEISGDVGGLTQL